MLRTIILSFRKHYLICSLLCINRAILSGPVSGARVHTENSFGNGIVSGGNRVAQQLLRFNDDGDENPEDESPEEKEMFARKHEERRGNFDTLTSSRVSAFSAKVLRADQITEYRSKYLARTASSPPPEAETLLRNRIPCVTRFLHTMLRSTYVRISNRKQ